MSRMSNRLLYDSMAKVNFSTHVVAPVNQLPWYFHQKAEIPFIFCTINHYLVEITWNEHLVCDYTSVKNAGV